MNPEKQEQWAAACESGDYPQGIGQLRQPGEGGRFYYCCLGVLADLAGKDPACEFSWADVVDGAGLLPSAVIQWAEIRREDDLNDSRDPAIVVTGRRHITAAYANDTLCWSLPEIGHAIRTGENPREVPADA
jgi:hypothetical protein